MAEHHYIYLLQEREFFNNKDNVYKLGKTTQELVKRFAGYPKGTVIILTINVIVSDESETHLLEIFREKFVSRNDYGTEHFQGDLMEMIKILHMHQLEQIELTRNDVVVSPPIVKYENTVIEFLEKRTLPMVYGDSRIPVTSNVEFQLLAQFYREWCKENKKRALVGAEVIKTHVNKFLENWVKVKREYFGKNKTITSYKVNIYNKDSECENGGELIYDPKSWIWHFTTSVDEINEERDIISPKTGLHLSATLPQRFLKLDRNSRNRLIPDKIKLSELKCYSRKGWTIDVVVYSKYLELCGLSIEKPPNTKLLEREKTCEEAQAIRFAVNLVGGSVLKTWLSSDEKNPGLIAKYGKTKIFVPYLGCDTWKLSDLEDRLENYVTLLSTIWSGPILFHNKGYIRHAKQNFIGWGIKHTWAENKEICDVYFLDNQLIFEQRRSKVRKSDSIRTETVEKYFSIDESDKNWALYVQTVHDNLLMGFLTEGDDKIKKLPDEKLTVFTKDELVRFLRRSMINDGIVPQNWLSPHLFHEFITIGNYSFGLSPKENVPDGIFKKITRLDFINLFNEKWQKIHPKLSGDFLQVSVLSNMKGSATVREEINLINFLKKELNESYTSHPEAYKVRDSTINYDLFRNPKEAKPYLEAIKSKIGNDKFQYICAAVKDEFDITYSIGEDIYRE